MDPASGLGLAVNILQVVETAGKLVSTAVQLSRSPTGALADNLAIETASADLVECLNDLALSEVASDARLKTLAEHSSGLAKKILTVLGTAKVERNSNKWRVLKKAIRNVWVENEISRMETRLGHLKLQLIVHIFISLATQNGGMQDTLRSMTEIIQKMDDKLEGLEEIKALLSPCKTERSADGQEHWSIEAEIKNALILEETPKDGCVADTLSSGWLRGVLEMQSSIPEEPLPVRPLQVLSISRMATLRGHLNTRSHCETVSCNCACHLRRYYRTPLFMERFLGALAFKGVCRNHPAKSWALKYWIPEWISSYNVSLWFEQNLCGTPSFGLRFQRKVPWGNEDTIIRFSSQGDTEGIKAILESGKGSLNDVDPNHGLTPLHFAVQKGHVRACRLLLLVGADTSVEDGSGMSASQRAWDLILTNRYAPRHLEALKTMFPDVDLDSWMFSPLHQAVLGIGRLCLAEQLRGSGIDPAIVNAGDSRQRTPLHWAALRGDLKAAELLLDAGACVNAIDRFSCTPLLYAASSAAPRMIELLILRKADVNLSNNDGDTPLHYAARERDDIEVAKILLQAGAQVDRRNFLGNTPFAAAAFFNRPAPGRYLLERGADRYSRNRYGDSPLRDAIYHNCHGFLRMLLEAQTRYNDVNRSGTTTLHAVALEADVETVKILKEFKIAGLDTQMRNITGKTAADICKDRMGPPDGFVREFTELMATLGPTIDPDT